LDFQTRDHFEQNKLQDVLTSFYIYGRVFFTSMLAPKYIVVLLLFYLATYCM
jgi:hypothetical protein